MDGLEFAEKVIGHLVTLVVAFAWPAVFVYFLYTQRAAFTKLIESLKIKSIKAFGGELETQLEENTKTIGQAAAVAEIKWEYEPPSTDPNKLAETARTIHEYIDAYTLSSDIAADALRTKPAVIIERAWRDVEGLLFRVVEGGEQPSFTSMSGNELLRRASSRKVVDRKLLEAIAGLLNIWNETITGIAGWEPTREQAAEFVANAKEVMRLLGPYLTVGLAKEPVDGERTISGGQ